MLKRSFDITVSATALVVLMPALLALALLVRLTSPGPALYKARRVGRGGRLFTLYKFRSMRADADRNGPAVTAAGDTRVTPVGRLLRKTKMDELPQLYNVLRGDMSLVGPRPEDPKYVQLYTPEQRRILNVRPGITSLASIQYRDEETLLTGDDWQALYVNEVMPSKLALDLRYLDRPTLAADIVILLKTIKAVLQ